MLCVVTTARSWEAAPEGRAVCRPDPQSHTLSARRVAATGRLAASKDLPAEVTEMARWRKIG